MKINKLDNVIIDLKSGHKYADCDIKAGENIVKYGCPIGHATEDIKKGDHVHTHNTKTNNKQKIINLKFNYYEKAFYNFGLRSSNGCLRE